MPSVNLSITPQGAILDTLIGVSAPRREALAKAGLPIPAPANARLLIDTGASSTCVDSKIIQYLGISPSGMVQIHTPSTSSAAAHPCSQYDVSLLIPHQAINYVFHALPVIETSLGHQGIDGLLGRDVLASCLFIYNGESRVYTLSF